MSFAILTALLGFAFVATVTPGPNNLMLMASGANFGFRRTLPHMFGIVGGVTVMALLVGAGLMALFDAVPALTLVLEVLSVGYLLWLALKIATAAPVEERDADSRPMTFRQAATFQWVNPKAWAMCLSAITLYAPDRSLLSVAIVAGAFALLQGVGGKLCFRSPAGLFFFVGSEFALHILGQHGARHSVPIRIKITRIIFRAVAMLCPVVIQLLIVFKVAAAL